MREGLREIPKQAPFHGIVFFREQPHIVADRQQPLEQPARLRAAPHPPIGVGEPEGAREKDAFARRETVPRLARAGLVSLEKTLPHQTSLDRLDRAAHAVIVRRKESHEGNEEKACVDLARAVVLRERPALRVASATAY